MRIKQLACSGIFALVLAGCGGTSLVSPFIGTFTGTWSQSSPSVNGTANLISLPGGSTSGTLHDSTNNVDYTISGTIGSNGAVNFNLIPASGTITGGLGFNGSGQVIGTLTNTSGPFNAMSFVLTQQ